MLKTVELTSIITVFPSQGVVGLAVCVGNDWFGEVLEDGRLGYGVVGLVCV